MDRGTTPNESREVRGKGIVPVEKRAVVAQYFSLYRWFLPGDAKWEGKNPGRVWSRLGRDPNDGAVFRLAASLPPKAERCEK